MAQHLGSTVHTGIQGAQRATDPQVGKRCSRDGLDINFLVKRSGITSVAEVLELFEEFFPEDPFPDRTLPLLDEAIAASVPSRRERLRSRMDISSLRM